MFYDGTLQREFSELLQVVGELAKYELPAAADRLETYVELSDVENKAINELIVALRADERPSDEVLENAVMMLLEYIEDIAVVGFEKS